MAQPQQPQQQSETDAPMQEQRMQCGADEGALAPPTPAPALAPSSAASALAAARARRLLYAHPPVLSLARSHRLLSEPPAYAQAASVSFRALLHASPSRSMQPATTAILAPLPQPAAPAPAPLPLQLQRTKSARGDASPAAAGASGPSTRIAAPQMPPSHQPLSYVGEQALLHDAHAFLHTLAWALRMPARVHADAALALTKYCALVPLQQAQPFVIAPVQEDVASSTPSSSPGSSVSSNAEAAALVSAAPPHGLYIMATASLFLSCKAMDTPRKLNDFIDAHVALATLLLRIRKSKEATAASRKRGAAVQLERMWAVWRDLYAQSITPTSSPASTGFPFTAAPPAAFHPATLQFPSASPSFSPTPEWTALRESVVYAEFMLLTHATEFAFNNALTNLDKERKEGSAYQTVQQLLWELLDDDDGRGAEGQERDATAVATPASPPSSISLRCSRLAWHLTHASVRSSVFLHSNAYVASIAIVFLAAYAFRRGHGTVQPSPPPAPATASAFAAPAASSLPATPATPSSSSAAETVPVPTEKADTDTVMLDASAAAAPGSEVPPVDASMSSAPDTPASSTAAAISEVHIAAAAAASSERPSTPFIDLDACVDRKGWAPRFRVVDPVATTAFAGGAPATDTSATSQAPTPHSARLAWYHTFCPTMTDDLLLALCEIIMEAAVTAPPVHGAATDPCATEVQRLADAYPWGLGVSAQSQSSSSSSAAATAASSSAHMWSNVAEQVVLVRPADDADYPYVEHFPREVHVDRPMMTDEPFEPDSAALLAEHDAAAAYGANGGNSCSSSSSRHSRGGSKQRSSRKERSEQPEGETDAMESVPLGAQEQQAALAQALLPLPPPPPPTHMPPPPPVAAPPSAPSHYIHPSRLAAVAPPSSLPAPPGAAPSHPPAPAAAPRTRWGSAPAGAGDHAPSQQAAAPRMTQVEQQLAQAKEALRRSGIALHAGAADAHESKVQVSDMATADRSGGGADRGPSFAASAASSSRATSRSPSRSSRSASRSRSPHSHRRRSSSSRHASDHPRGGDSSSRRNSRARDSFSRTSRSRRYDDDDERHADRRGGAPHHYVRDERDRCDHARDRPYERDRDRERERSFNHRGTGVDERDPKRPRRSASRDRPPVSDRAPLPSGREHEFRAAADPRRDLHPRSPPRDSFGRRSPPRSGRGGGFGAADSGDRGGRGRWGESDRERDRDHVHGGHLHPDAAGRAHASDAYNPGSASASGSKRRRDEPRLHDERARGGGGGGGGSGGGRGEWSHGERERERERDRDFRGDAWDGGRGGAGSYGHPARGEPSPYRGRSEPDRRTSYGRR